MMSKIFLNAYHTSFLILIFPVVIGIIGYAISKRYQLISNVIFFILSFAPLSFFIYIQSFSTKKPLLILKTFNLMENVNITLQTSQMGNVFGLILATLYPIVTIYSIAYFQISHERKAGKFHVLMYFSILFGLCLAYSANMFTAFIFYDLITISTYFLIIQTKGVKTAAASTKYITFLLAPSLLMLLPAMITIYNSTYTLSFDKNGIIANIPFSKNAINILFAMCFFGIAKTAILPLSQWIIEAMIAPVPISAMLHAVLVVKAGIIMLYKVSYQIFGMEILQTNLISFYNIQWPLYITIATVIFGSIFAIDSDNMKKRLAYSTISHINIIVMILMFFNQESTKIAQIAMVSHSLAKINLFFYVGYLYSKYTATEIEHLPFCKDKNNLVTASAAFSILSLIGMPFTLGYSSKHQIIEFANNLPINKIITAIIFFTTILSIIYTGPFLRTMFIKKSYMSNYDHYIFEKRLPRYISFLFSIAMLLPVILTIIMYIALKFDLLKF